MKYFLLLLLFIPIRTETLVYDTDYNMHTIEFSYHNVSTNNLNDILPHIKIIWIESLKPNYRYYFEDISFNDNINKFKYHYYLNLDYVSRINAEILGIKISKVGVFSSLEEINKLNIDGAYIN